jgi:metal-responsive CopG/Arc/MetJ family transcriptional regulator
MISLRLTKSLLERIEKFVKKNTPAIKDRTQAIEVALERLINSA